MNNFYINIEPSDTVKEIIFQQLRAGMNIREIYDKLGWSLPETTHCPTCGHQKETE